MSSKKKKPKAAKADSKTPDTKKADTKKPKAAKAEKKKADTKKPKAAKAEKKKANTKKPKAAKAEKKKANTKKAKRAGPPSISLLGAGARGQSPRTSSALLDDLVQRAKKVRKKAYAPYSTYKVGAAIATESGKIFEGCNVENASFGATICAERGAIMQMIAAGEDKPVAIAVVTQDSEPASPCGICRQVLSEFAPDLVIALVGLGAEDDDEIGKVVRLGELLPMQFRLKKR